ncbi:hypothetical protein CPB83DRAFT_338490 [Crepidotus variabilis]|uniref:Uncharacterized protein n=1 Tax=Crepidotus variabilis TaxID=179855 RepID=A0A9P6ES98_9AGAR|nr:hypothetical protein CPB83DRAFT_338490 [Crepidotus variabilis]
MHCTIEYRMRSCRLSFSNTTLLYQMNPSRINSDAVSANITRSTSSKTPLSAGFSNLKSVLQQNIDISKTCLDQLQATNSNVESDSSEASSELFQNLLDETGQVAAMIAGNGQRQGSKENLSYAVEISEVNQCIHEDRLLNIKETLEGLKIHFL